MKEDTILKVLPWDVRSIIQKEKLEFEYLQEIRLREGKPLIFLYHDTEVIPGAKARRPYLVTKDNIREMLEYISNYSLYACEQEMRQGFITIEGGHRVGLSGQAIMENGKVKNLKYISSVNIRVAHEMIGCADAVFPYIVCNRLLCHTLIVSPPGCGAYGHFPRPSGPRSPARQGHIKRPVLRLAEPSFLRPANQCC